VHAVAFPAADVTHPRPRRRSFDRLRQ
jgi:hypothetical protein